MLRVTNRVLAGIAIGAMCAVAAAGMYTESHHAPDQP